MYVVSASSKAVGIQRYVRKEEVGSTEKRVMSSTGFATLYSESPRSKVVLPVLGITGFASVSTTSALVILALQFCKTRRPDPISASAISSFGDEGSLALDELTQ